LRDQRNVWKQLSRSGTPTRESPKQTARLSLVQNPPVQERGLTANERAVLEKIVGAVRFRDDYLAQIAVARVVDRSHCCPSIALRIPPLTADRAPEGSSAVQYPIAAEGEWTSPSGQPMQLMVFQRDGWLSYLDLVHYEENMSDKPLPPADQVIVVTNS
jgi:hypothetical protein